MRALSAHLKCLEPGVMEYWSIGVSREVIQPSDITPALQYSNTTKLTFIQWLRIDSPSESCACSAPGSHHI